jgi:hypothetical protein
VGESGHGALRLAPRAFEPLLTREVQTRHSARPSHRCLSGITHRCAAEERLDGAQSEDISATGPHRTRRPNPGAGGDRQDTERHDRADQVRRWYRISSEGAVCSASVLGRAAGEVVKHELRAGPLAVLRRLVVDCSAEAAAPCRRRTGECRPALAPGCESGLDLRRVGDGFVVAKQGVTGPGDVGDRFERHVAEGGIGGRHRVVELEADRVAARTMLAHPDEETLADAMLCTHGEVMRPLLRHIRRRHVAIIGEPARRGWLLRKGTAWQLDVADNGAITKLQAFPPTP